MISLSSTKVTFIGDFLGASYLKRGTSLLEDSPQGKGDKGLPSIMIQQVRYLRWFCPGGGNLIQGPHKIVKILWGESP
ncbi:MAG: hypothetical protein ACUVTR_06360, partial [Dehalococcoidia bacterium]